MKRIRKTDENLTPEIPTPRNGGPPPVPPVSTSTYPSHISLTRQACLLGLAMVPRGEIALIVAQLARPLLLLSSSKHGENGSSDALAVVTWAILVTTVGGAACTGIVLRHAKLGMQH
jgi:hypothetical protein